MLDNDELHEIPPHENLLNGERRINSCINKQMYQIINEKKGQLQLLKKEREKLLESFNDNNKFLLEKQELMKTLMIKKTNIQMLKDELALTDKRLAKNQDEIKNANTRIYKRKQMIDIYLDKIVRVKDLVKKSESNTYNKVNNEKDGLKILKLKLIEYQKQRIDELNRFIFELTEIKPKEEDVLQKSTRTNTLKDARQTVYVNGRWLTSNDQVIYRIVRSVLPTDGDYVTLFKDSFQKNDKLKDESHQLDDIERQFFQSNQSNNNKNILWASFTSSLSTNYNNKLDRTTILSGLTYTVQFVNLIAFYLNILLPYNLSHSKFYAQSLTDNQFQNAVAKLNTNIVYLSVNQHIPVNNLLPKHTLENLHHFLINFKEMKIKLRDKLSISFPSHMIPLLDEMFTEPAEEDNLMQDSIPNLIFNDSEEWETVPNSNEIPSDDSCNNMNQAQHRTVSTSLISSVLSQFWFKNNAQSK